jgi:hypothetical protein
LFPHASSPAILRKACLFLLHGRSLLFFRKNYSY